MYSDLLEGTVRREDVQEIKIFLEEEGKAGNRFVSFPADSERLRKEDFAGFKAAFDALEHAYDNSTDRDRYIALTIRTVQKEINQMLENEKAQQSEQSPTVSRTGERSIYQELLP